MLAKLNPEAGRLITASGPQVPVAFRMDDSQIRQTIAGVPKTPLFDGVERTYSIFGKLRREGRLA
jgi:hypothetical protein